MSYCCRNLSGVGVRQDHLTLTSSQLRLELLTKSRHASCCNDINGVCEDRNRLHQTLDLASICLSRVCGEIRL